MKRFRAWLSNPALGHCERIINAENAACAMAILIDHALVQPSRTMDLDKAIAAGALLVSITEDPEPIAQPS